MQQLTLPIPDCAFSAGYKNPAYLNQYGYAHYGVDLYSTAANTAVYACGDGEVCACGADGLFGNVIVIIYKDVEMPNGKTTNLACRMFHFASIAVKVGDKVNRGSIIGQYGNTGTTLVNGKPMGKHLHIEFDTDIQYPTYAVGIKASGNVIKKGSIDSTLNPSDIWYLGAGQTIKGIYDTWFTNADIALPKLTASITLTELTELLKARGIDRIEVK